MVLRGLRPKGKVTSRYIKDTMYGKDRVRLKGKI